MADEKVKQTAKEKAAQALEVATRKVDKLKARIEDVRAKGEALTADLATAEANRAYLAQHPALTQETAPAAPADEATEKPQDADRLAGF